MKKILLYILLFISRIAVSQNLVQNPSFEQYTSCPAGNSGITLATPWDVPPGSITTPDYLNSCSTGGFGCNAVSVPDNFLGSAYAANGNGYAAIITGLYDGCPVCREYIQSSLTSPLVAGTTYLVQMYVRPGDFNKYVVNNEGIYISIAQISQPGNQAITGVTPQAESATIISDTSQWTLVSGTFVAAGGEQYITIGNFHDNANTLLDTVSFPGGSCILVTEGAMYMIDSVYVGIANLSNFPAAGLMADDSSFCEVSCINFTDVSTNNPTSWQWYFPGAIPSSSTDQNPSNVCYDTAGTYDVTLIVANAFGADTIVMTSFVTVYPPPAANITQSNDTLYAAAAASYQWFTGGNAIAGATNSFYLPPSEDFYSVVITNADGCTASDTIYFSLASQSNFSAADTTICQKFCLDFFDQSGNNPTSWLWQFQGGSPSSSTLQNPMQICYNTPGLYSVTLITTNAFGSDTLTLLNYITVFATPPFPAITQAGYTLTSTSAASYQWQFNSVDIPGATNQSYTVLQSGLYTVIVGDSNNCVNSANQYVLISGIAELSDANISIYPNPSDGNFMVELSNGLIAGQVSIDVVNSLGQKVFSIEEKITATDIKKEIDLSDVARGVYFIGIKTENEFVRKKILLTK
ncbi:MAG TPA: PKD domain-containing protein [Chitinophagales bacterium]|nr:PKD domain-containing protein [Chitinophagales bacterium]